MDILNDLNIHKNAVIEFSKNETDGNNLGSIFIQNDNINISSGTSSDGYLCSNSNVNIVSGNNILLSNAVYLNNENCVGNGAITFDTGNLIKLTNNLDPYASGGFEFGCVGKLVYKTQSDEKSIILETNNTNSISLDSNNGVKINSYYNSIALSGTGVNIDTCVNIQDGSIYFTGNGARSIHGIRKISFDNDGINSKIENVGTIHVLSEFRIYSTRDSGGGCGCSSAEDNPSIDFLYNANGTSFIGFSCNSNGTEFGLFYDKPGVFSIYSKNDIFFETQGTSATPYSEETFLLSRKALSDIFAPGRVTDAEYIFNENNSEPCVDSCISHRDVPAYIPCNGTGNVYGPKNIIATVDYANNLVKQVITATEFAQHFEPMIKTAAKNGLGYRAALISKFTEFQIPSLVATNNKATHIESLKPLYIDSFYIDGNTTYERIFERFDETGLMAPMVQVFGYDDKCRITQKQVDTFFCKTTGELEIQIGTVSDVPAGCLFAKVFI